MERIDPPVHSLRVHPGRCKHYSEYNKTRLQAQTADGSACPTNASHQLRGQVGQALSPVNAFFRNLASMRADRTAMRKHADEREKLAH
jgi:hypothetical protein